MTETIALTSRHADLLNVLDAMQGCPAYALRRPELRAAEELIAVQERELDECKMALMAAEQRAAAYAAALKLTLAMLEQAASIIENNVSKTRGRREAGE